MASEPSRLRPPTETFWQFCAALNRYGVDYLVIADLKKDVDPKDLADVDLLTSDDPHR